MARKRSIQDLVRRINTLKATLLEAITKAELTKGKSPEIIRRFVELQKELTEEMKLLRSVLTERKIEEFKSKTKKELFDIREKAYKEGRELYHEGERLRKTIETPFGIKTTISRKEATNKSFKKTMRMIKRQAEEDAAQSHITELSLKRAKTRRRRR